MIKKIILVTIVFIKLSAVSMQIGNDAPEFILKDQEGFMHNLISHRGNFVLLFFYSKDFTLAAQKKMRQLEKLLDKSLNDKFVIYGISKDSIQKHHDFYKKMHISFDLLSDEEEKVITAYNAKGFIETKPLVVLIGPDGRLFRIYENMQKFLSSKDLINNIISDSL